MARSISSKARRLVRRFKRLPVWTKALAGATCCVLVLTGVAGALNAFALHPEYPTPIEPVVSDTAASPNQTPDMKMASKNDVPAPSALEGASGVQEINLFGAQQASRTLEVTEIGGIQEALAAFQNEGYQAGFVLYDFATQRGLGYNADEEFFSASTIKAPYVVYVAQSEVDRQQAALSDEVHESTIMDGTGIMASDNQDTYDLGTVLFNTIVHSDNTGYALLAERFGENFPSWAASLGVDASAWQGEWYPYYTPRDLAKLWLGVESYLQSAAPQSAFCTTLLSETGTSFIRETIGASHHVLSKAGYEIDTEYYDMGALNDAGIVQGETGNYLLVVMSDANYDDEYFTDTEPLIVNLIAALTSAHDRLLAG